MVGQAVCARKMNGLVTPVGTFSVVIELRYDNMKYTWAVSINFLSWREDDIRVVMYRAVPSPLPIVVWTLR